VQRRGSPQSVKRGLAGFWWPWSRSDARRDRHASRHLPEPRLLDATHIVMDADEQLGQPIVSNGLPLTKLHHAAFDTHLIGIDPDYGIHVSERLLEIHDGPFLELGLKGIAGTLIERPRRVEDRPDRDRLALRFEQFKKAA
jgi:putative restriction endonuclease